ncbi:MAG TPA: DinB family protein [Chloroflexia bacterium]|jgi:hypothetical protein
MIGSHDWLANQLKAGAEAFVWATRQIPPERLYATPPALLGDWTAARHVLHMADYERDVALPSIKQWFGGPYPLFEGYQRDAGYESGKGTEELLAELQAARTEQVALLARANPDTWQAIKKTAWGDRTLYWVTSKTYQHGIEHTNNVLKIALLWEHYEKRSQAKEPDLYE